MDALIKKHANKETIMSREQFLRAAVETLLNQVDAATLHTIVAVGRDEFVRHAKTSWIGHGFTQDDFFTAFEQLTHRAREVPLPSELRTGVAHADG
jgi:hypothetical protein